jgi:2-amino-4-hydroxy-6-hydroxymethyldihydropteridine diphosphokinase
MPEALIGLGSNFEPESALLVAVSALEARFGSVALSSVYRGAAAGGEAPDYLNMVASIATSADVDELRAVLAAIETATGRTRDDPRVCRLDLDLLTHGERVDALRRLPRPGMFSQSFVLVPLAEVAPGFVHPLTGERCVTGLAALRGVPRLARLGPITALRD